MSFNPEDFFPSEHKRPEKFPVDYEDKLKEDCSSCGLQLGIHSTKEIVQCALNEIRGENPKG